MKKVLFAVTAILALAVTAVAYGQGGVAVQNEYEVEAKTSPTREGTSRSPVPVGLEFGFTVDEANGLRPSPIESYSIRFRGLQVNPRVAADCRLSRLEARGVDACPRRSILGEGFIRNATGATDNPADRSIPCNAKLTVINGGRSNVWIYVAGTPTARDERERCSIDLAAPIEAKFRKRGGDLALEFEVPDSLLHPLPTLTNAVTRVTSKLDRMTRRIGGKRRGYLESRGGCSRGERRISVVFTAENGDRDVTRGTARCRDSRRRR